MNQSGYCQPFNEFILSYNKYINNEEVLKKANDLQIIHKLSESKKILDNYNKFKCDFLNLQFYISYLSVGELLGDSTTIATNLRHAILAGYHPKYFKLEKWKKFITETEIDSLHTLYINSLNLDYAIKLSKMFDNDQGYRNSIKVKDSLKHIDSVNIILFDNLIQKYGYPSLNKYGNDFMLDNVSINCSPYILITHFGEDYWHRYLDSMIYNAYNEMDSWYDVDFIIKTLILRKSSSSYYIPLRFVGLDLVKEFLTLNALYNLFKQYPNLTFEIQFFKGLEFNTINELKQKLLKCTLNVDQIVFNEQHFNVNNDSYGNYLIQIRRKGVLK